MTLNAYFLEKPTCRRESWLIKSTYPQNIQRTLATLVNKRSHGLLCPSVATEGGRRERAALEPGIAELSQGGSARGRANATPEPPSRHAVPLAARGRGVERLWKSGTRRPVSRVLCRPQPRSSGHWRSFLWTAPRGTVLATYPDRSGLRQPYPPLPEGQGERTVPIRSCSWRGLPCRPCYQARGGLLPHPFTLTPDESGAVCSLWRYP
jgi:hypothetical protein